MKHIRSIFSILVLVSVSSAAAQTRIHQTTSGGNSPAVNTNSGDVSIVYGQPGPTASEPEAVLEVTSRFYNDYLKYLNKSFSRLDDESGFSSPPARNPDGSIDLSQVTSAPAYGVSKLSLAEYLYTREEISHSFAQRIDEMILAAARDSEMGALEYDPILMAQDTPNFLDYATPQVNGSSATITVFTVWEWGDESSKNPINVSLRKVGRTWRITDIQDGRDW